MVLVTFLEGELVPEAQSQLRPSGVATATNVSALGEWARNVRWPRRRSNADADADAPRKDGRR